MTLCHIHQQDPTSPSQKLPLVLIHGWGNHSAIWQPVLNSLVSDRTCYLVDLPGFGESSNYTCAWPAVINELSQRLPTAYIVMGWSLGGMLAVQLAAASTHAKALLTLASNAVFVATPAWPQAMPVEVFEQFCQAFKGDPAATWQHFIALQLQGEPGRKVLARQLNELLPQALHPDSWQNSLGWLATLDNRHCLNQLSIPQAHLFGAKDALVPAAAASFIAYSQVLPDAGHLLPLSQTQAINKTLLELEVKLQPLPNKQRVAASFGRAANRYDKSAHLQQAVGLKLISLLPQTGPGQSLADLGCGTGFLSQQLPQHTLIALDIATEMLHQARQQLGDKAFYIQADAENLPLATHSQQGVLANLSLQWCDLGKVLQEVYRVLMPGGWCLFSTLGSRSLYELREAWSSLDDRVHINRFLTEQEVRQAVNQTGLRIDHFVSRDHKVTSQTLLPILKDLKAIGANNLNSGQKRGLMTPKAWARLQERYEIYRDEEGEVVATYEVFYILAFKLP